MKALVLFSGGLDSSVCLGMAVNRYGADEVLALSIYYGQKHKKEMEASEKIAAYYGVRRITLDLGEIFRDSTCTLLEGAEGDIPHEEYAEQLSKTENAPVSTYVPFRNGLFLSSAASIVLSHGCEVINYGAHADDAAGNVLYASTFLVTDILSEKYGKKEASKAVAYSFSKQSLLFWIRRSCTWHGRSCR